MSLNKGELNPLNVLGFRKLSFIPKHFSKICISFKIDQRAVEHWIEYNLNSRYSIQHKQILDQNKKIIQVLEIGLEDPKEMTLLNLGCHHLHKK